MNIYVIISLVTGVLAILYGLFQKENRGKQMSLVLTSIFSFIIAFLIYLNLIDGVFFFLNIIFYWFISLIFNKKPVEK